MAGAFLKSQSTSEMALPHVDQETMNITSMQRNWMWAKPSISITTHKWILPALLCYRRRYPTHDPNSEVHYGKATCVFQGFQTKPLPY